jgi:hypothetical protein
MSVRGHAQFDGLAALHATGAVDAQERGALERHLEVCLECVSEVKTLLPITHALVHGAPPLAPPAALRRRLLNRVTGAGYDEQTVVDPLDTFAAVEDKDRPTVPEPATKRGAGGLFWAAAILLIAAAGAVGWYIGELDRQARDLGDRLRTADARADQTAAALAAEQARSRVRDQVVTMLSEPGVQRLELLGQPIAPRAAGRALWSDTSELVVVATGLPALPSGDVYQLWFGTIDGPLGAGLMEPNQDGQALLRVPLPELVVMPVPMALTVEPFGGMPAPTGDIYLLGQGTP